MPQILPIGVAVSALPLAAEDRTGYQRTSFRHWNACANPTDGCNTRMEVLIAEAVEAPEVGPGCILTGGAWRSYYDGVLTNDARTFDNDHLVPRAEAWDSGASAWTAARREAYANDLDQEASLVAVSARSNRSKADQDPAQWVPPSAEALCRYGSEWTATKMRWVDEAPAPGHRRWLWRHPRGVHPGTVEPGQESPRPSRPHDARGGRPGWHAKGSSAEW
ncbi:DUF1524 domain-containing protein [Streptomyces sp. NPDC059525]|uniref:GmrSD restriction endonuclease domain-containing protein n=1 Tax=Streptomyces sp. NPDC059525 TaxID=3346857 RepID=UPI0036874070